jgi:serine/threonine-protein kinase PknK
MAVPSRAWLAGAELGQRFADVHLLHAGARFTIYAGHDIDANRNVVIKVPDDSSGSWLHEVLLDEAIVLAAIGDHPHVVSYYEQLRLPDGRPGLLFEPCRGTLYETLRRDDALAVQDAVSVGIKLAGALETAHRAGVVHCDVRPGNVLLTDGGEPVLAGFDEAVRIQASSSRPPLHQFTPHTAPELVEGAQPTTASDVYGLASTLYEMVAGRAAFREYVGESPASVIVRVLSNPVLPIVGAHVPIEISDLLTWGLSSDPADRPPSPVWMAEELARVERRQGWPRTRPH